MISRFGESVFLSRYLYGVGLFCIIVFMLHLLACAWCGAIFAAAIKSVRGWPRKSHVG